MSYSFVALELVLELVVDSDTFATSLELVGKLRISSCTSRRAVLGAVRVTVAAEEAATQVVVDAAGLCMVEEHRNSECPHCYLVGQSRHRGENQECQDNIT